MHTHRSTATFVGLSFLVAMVASLVGGGVLESVLAPLAAAGSAPGGGAALTLGVGLELTNALAVVAIAVGLYPLFRARWESAALGYVAVRLLEATFLAIAALVPVVLASSSRAGDVASSGPLLSLLALRSDILGVMIPLFFAVGALLLYAWLYATALLPRFIAVWGLIGVVSIVLVNLIDAAVWLELALALPIIANEVFLGIWLIAFGFRAPEGANLARRRRATVR